MQEIQIKIGLGQDSHIFEDNENKPLILGGFKIANHPGFKANSDGDVILHAITNAISSVTGKAILGEIADNLCKNGQTDSKAYLKLALSDSRSQNWKIAHVAISIEALRPKLSGYINQITKSVASIMDISEQDIGITATSGEGLTDFGKGLGMQALVVITMQR